MLDEDILKKGFCLDRLCNTDFLSCGLYDKLYNAALSLSENEPLSLRAARKLAEHTGKNETVFILTGFVLIPFGKAETDGLISSMLLAKALVSYLSTNVCLVCPAECKNAIVDISEFLELSENIGENSTFFRTEIFTKDADYAEKNADMLINKYKPSAVVSIECPGANNAGCYHNAAGQNVTQYEAKIDILFNKLKNQGNLNIAIGDLGNEIGMGKIADTVDSLVPYGKKEGKHCACGKTISAESAADYLITSAVSDWGCYAMLAALAFLKNDIRIMPDRNIQNRTAKIAARNGIINMDGKDNAYVDGFSLQINGDIIEMMTELLI